MKLRRRRQALESLDADMRDHIEREIEDNVERGMQPDEARYAALRKFGNVTRLKEETRSVWSFIWLEQTLQDVRYGLRVLGRNAGFTATVILTLALGIGATTAIFSVVDTIMLKPLPFPTADRLVRIRSVSASSGTGNGIASYPDFLDWRSRSHVFDGMAAFRRQDFNLTGPRQPLHLRGAVVSAKLFSLLGVAPELGRTFIPEEDNPAAASGTDPLVLSHGLWQREFASDPGVAGRTIRLGDRLFTVVGVMPQTFHFPVEAEPVELWTTIAVDAGGGIKAITAQRGAHYLDVVGLLKPGAGIEQAQAEVAAITSALNKEHTENRPRTVRIVPEIDGVVGPLHTPLLVLLGAVGCVLLMVCVNVANLLLARASARGKEMAVRTALGAGRRRVIRQLLTESILLGVLGGGLGLAMAVAGLRLLVSLIPAEVPRLSEIGLDARLLAFALLISLVAGILFGLAPALRVSKIMLSQSLRKSGRGPGNGAREHSRLRGVLIVSEVAIAVVLLSGTGLLIQSFLRLTQVDPGFKRDHVLTLQLDSPAGKEDARIAVFFHNVTERIAALPGVVSASAVASLPLTGENIRSSVETEDQPTSPDSRPSVNFNAIEPGYFRTLGITLAAGRDFTVHDNLKSTPVAIVSRTLARNFFGNQNPIGRRIRPGIANGYGPGESPMREIVGVADDVKQGELGSDHAPEVYAPLAQCPFSPVSIVLRTAHDPRSMAEPVRREVALLDRNTPIYRVETLDQYFAQSVAVPGFIALLLSGFAFVALLLACVGVYGVISYLFLQRTHEIGIRMALGAQKSRVLGMVIAEGLRPALAGLVIGLAASFRFTGVLSTLLYGTKPTDPLTFAAVSLILTAVALLASYFPARRAAQSDPMVSLHSE